MWKYIYVTKKEDQVDIEKVIVGDETLDLYVLQPIESDRILVGTSNGIRILRKVNRQWCDDQISILSHSKIRSMALKENNVYIGTEGNGLYTWNISQGLEFQTSTLRRHQEVGLDFIISMKVDKVGSLWVGSWLGGVSQLTFSPNGFTIIRNQENVKSIFRILFGVLQIHCWILQFIWEHMGPDYVNMFPKRKLFV